MVTTNRRRDYFLGALVNFVVAGLIYPWSQGHFGQTPLFVATFGIFPPIVVPFFFLLLKRPPMGAGAIIAGAALFMFSLFFGRS